MSGCSYKTYFLLVVAAMFSFQAFSQQTDIDTRLTGDKTETILFKPVLHYSAGSSFLFAPHLGSVSSINLATAVSVPLSPKLSVEGGIMASYYYSAPFKTEITGFPYGSFNGLSVYGAAIYQFTPQLTLYGSAINQIAGTSPFYSLPKSSYTIGSAYNFGSFSIGVSFQMSNWDNINSPFPMNGSQGLYSPFGQGRFPY
jgi:hypothetical protein